MSRKDTEATPRNRWLLLGWLALVSTALLGVLPGVLPAQAPVATFVNGTDRPIFLKIHLTDDPALCAEGEYVTYEIPSDEEKTVEFGESTSACYCALAVPRDTCEFPETTQPGEAVVLETVEGEQESSQGPRLTPTAPASPGTPRAPGLAHPQGAVPDSFEQS